MTLRTFNIQELEEESQLLEREFNGWVVALSELPVPKDDSTPQLEQYMKNELMELVIDQRLNEQLLERRIELGAAA